MIPVEKPVWMGLLMAAFAVSLGCGMIAPYIGPLSRDGVSGVVLGVLSASYPLAKAVGFPASALLRRQPRMGHLLGVACVAYAALALFSGGVVWPHPGLRLVCLRGLMLFWQPRSS